jgi:hypothetical protein
MGELSSRRSGRSGPKWTGLPFALALVLAAATLNASLAPAPGAEELRFARPPPAPTVPSVPEHHEAPLYDSDEPVSV